jgi:Domain of unknown function (DUF397)
MQLESAGLAWRKATASAGKSACVEVAPLEAGVAVRHSKDPDRAPLLYTTTEWSAFLHGVKAGEFDF